MQELPRINIQPGELYVTRDPAILKTILGSCVGVTFWSPRLGVGALCHGILPRCPTGTSGAAGYRYVDSAIRYLAGRFDKLGARRDELEIKIFGGADVLPVAAPRADRPTIGAQNCRRALEVLAEEGFRIRASDLGGLRGRTIDFHTGTGDVLARLLARLHTPEPAPNRVLLPIRKLKF